MVAWGQGLGPHVSIDDGISRSLLGVGDPAVWGPPVGSPLVLFSRVPEGVLVVGGVGVSPSGGGLGKGDVSADLIHDASTRSEVVVSVDLSIQNNSNSINNSNGIVFPAGVQIVAPDSPEEPTMVPLGERGPSSPSGRLRDRFRWSPPSAIMRRCLGIMWRYLGIMWRWRW